jgi:exodeoxyribonuclease-1
MLINASKHGAIEFMKSKTAFCLGEVSFGNLSSSLVTAVALNAGNSGQMAVFDLAYRPDAYLDLSVEALVEVLNGREPAIRVVAANNQPIIVDTRIGHALIEASTFGRETLAEHALQIRAADAFRQRVAQALTLRFEEKAPSAYAERRIYDGFPHRADERLMQQFHQADWTERHGLCGRFDDLRYAEFGLKLLYAERPDALPPDVRHDVERHIRERLLAEGDDVPWLTLAGALAAIAALRADGEDAGLLDEIEQFVQQMRRHVLATAA